jgi:hypothetical protein
MFRRNASDRVHAPHACLPEGNGEPRGESADHRRSHRHLYQRDAGKITDVVHEAVALHGSAVPCGFLEAPHAQMELRFVATPTDTDPWNFPVPARTVPTAAGNSRQFGALPPFDHDRVYLEKGPPSFFFFSLLGGFFLFVCCLVWQLSS